MRSERSGISFEKAVALVQSQFDPAAKVTHDEVIVDRLGHARQFDVVIRGKFAGQSLLGVIECKDLRRKVGSPDIDAFVTKSADVNANVRLFMSRRGFTRPALEKCAHYGIQPLSLLGHDSPDLRVFLGTRWEADRIRWGQILLTLRFVKEPDPPIQFKADTLTIHGKRVLDWFTNYLLTQQDAVTDFGWVIGVGVEFSAPQPVDLSPGETHMCRAIDFHAERVCEKFERMVAVSGTGFYDWNARRATFPPGATIATESVLMDFDEWKPVSEAARPPPGFMTVHMITREVQFEHVPDAIDLESL